MINFTYQIQATPRVRILSGGRYLQINNADLGDAATYTCVASNVAGKTTREFILTVNGKENLIILLQFKTLAEGIQSNEHAKLIVVVILLLLKETCSICIVVIFNITLFQKIIKGALPYLRG